MKKKILALALAFAMVFTLAACGETNSTQQYKVDEKYVDAFDYSNATFFTGLKANSLPAQQFADDLLVYVYTIPATSATTAINSYCTSLTTGPSLFARYYDLTAIPNLLSKITGFDTSKLSGFGNLSFLYNLSANNAILVGTMTIGTITIVVVIPDFVKAATDFNPIITWLQNLDFSKLKR